MNHSSVLRLLTAASTGLALASAAGAQNLIPNPSFEDLWKCPPWWTDIYVVPPWDQAGTGTCDAFHRCATSKHVAVPKNMSGKQDPFHGDGYAGIIVYVTSEEYREYLQAPLLSPLVAGQRYALTFFVSLGDDSEYLVGDIGAYFSVGKITRSDDNAIPVTPQISNNSGPLGDKDHWMPVSGSFVANGGEDHIIIGVFKSDANLWVGQSSGFNPRDNASYYYVDMIALNCVCQGPPQVEQHPLGVSAPCGGSALLTASFISDCNKASYQWYCVDCGPTPQPVPANPALVSGTQTTQLLFTGAGAIHYRGKSFKLVASNDCGQTSTAPARVDTIPPPLTLQPQDVTICPPQAATFSVAGSGGGLTYQWYSKPIGKPAYKFQWFEGGTSPTLTPTLPGDMCGGEVYCVVSGPCGSQTSRSAIVNCCPCEPPPVGMSLWLPFDEVSGAPSVTRNAVAYGWNGVLMPMGSGPTLYTGQYAGNSMWFDGIDDHVRVSSHSAIDITNGDLSIDAWVFFEGNDTRKSIIADKTGTPGGGITGYQMFVMGVGAGGHILGFQMADATQQAWLANLSSAMSQGWHHVVVTVSRSSNTGGRFYVDGVHVGTFDPRGHTGSLSNTSPLTVGASSTGTSDFFFGAIDEVEVFGRALNALEVSRLHAAKAVGKCKQYVHALPATIFCHDSTSAIVGAVAFNYTSAPAVFSGAFNPLTCLSNPPPTNFPVVVPPTGVGAWNWGIVYATANKPALLAANAPSCFSVDLVTTGAVMSGRGHIVNRPDIYCANGPMTMVTLPYGQGGTATLSFGNAGVGSGVIPYRVQAIGPDGEPSTTVSLNGLPPGEAFFGTAIVPMGEEFSLAVETMFVGVDALGLTQLVLSTDVPGTGEYLPAAGVGLLCKVLPPACAADMNQDGQLDLEDLFAFLSAFDAANPAADVTQDGQVDLNDLFAFFASWEEGCGG